MTAAALLLLSLALIGLFILIIVVMNKSLDKSDNMNEAIQELTQQIAQLKNQSTNAPPAEKPAESNVCLTPECMVNVGRIIKSMDLTVNPCQNFYEFTCNGFINDPSHPQDVNTYLPQHELQDIITVDLKKKIEMDGYLLNGQYSSAIEKYETYYQTCLNGDDVQGLQPIIETINEVGGWTLSSNPGLIKWEESTSKSFEENLAIAHRMKGYAYMYPQVGTDIKNAQENTIIIDQGGRNLGNYRQYDDPYWDKYKLVITDAITELALLMDGSNVTEEASKMAELDKAIALSQVQQRSSALAFYTPLTVQEMTDLTGGLFDFAKYFSVFIGQPISPTERVVCYSTVYFENLGKVLNQTSPETLQNYLVFMVLRLGFSYLPSKFDDMVTNFYRGIFGSYSGSSNSWEACLSRAGGALPYAQGALFVNGNFDEEDKEQITGMSDRIRRAFIQNLQALGWMDPVTQEAAKEKANLVALNLGYPDWILDPAKLDAYYADIVISNVSTWLNKFEENKFDVLETVMKYGQPVKRDEFDIAPTDVTAFYRPTANSMNVAAGILGVPYFGKDVPRAMNYGGIGAVIAHEFTHGFDTIGKAYDGKGDYFDWWQNSSAFAYDERAQCFINQYDALSVLGINVNGRFTLSENIADNGGVRLAYDAYKLWQKENAVENIMPGLNMTLDQLFFIGFAQQWCLYITEAYQSFLIRVDNHSPYEFRVNVPLQNMPEFAETFNCSLGTEMNPEHKCAIWI